MTDPVVTQMRFARVRGARAYRLAMEEPCPRPTGHWWPAFGVVLALVLVGAPFAIAGAGLWFVVCPVGVVLLGVAIGGAVRTVRAPIERKLVVVVSGWTGLYGTGAQQSVGRSVTLVDETGLERDYIVTEAVIGDALDASIGVATIRYGRLVRFANLDHL